MSTELLVGLRVERTNPDAPGLIDEWRTLWHRSPHATVFQSPEWLLSWLECFTPADPWLLTFRDGNRLAGLAPLQLWNDQGLRRVIFLGTGLTDSLDILATHQALPSVSAALFEYLRRHETDWDICLFEQLTGASAILQQPVPSHWHSAIEFQDVSPVLLLPESETTVPRVKELAQLRRRMKKAGCMEFIAPTDSNLAWCIDSLFRLHSARWSIRHESGMLGDPSISGFHRLVIQRMHRIQRLRLYILCVSDVAVAAYYGFTHRDRAYYYLGGFLPEWKQYSPGTLVVGHAIASAMKEGLAQFDFLRGAELYKYRWGARDRFTYKRSITRS